MSDFIKIEITGLVEKQQAFSQFANDFGQATADGLQEGMLPMTGAMRTYPPRSSSYVRTGNYGQRITTPYITNDGGYVTGNIDSGADCAIYVAGTPDAPYQAWMHVGFWETLFSIVQRLLPGVVDAVQGRIDALAARLGL